MTDPLTDVWVEHRAYVVDLAFRMLGNIHDAEDVVQDAFGRLLAQDLDEIDEIRGWLVVVVSRLCLDQLRSARVRHQGSNDGLDEPTEVVAGPPPPVDPADRVTLDDSIHMALLVVLQRLTPAERAVFVLHDVFRYSFDAIAEIVGRSPAACRQLASRARKRVESEGAPARFDASPADQHRVAQRFIAACAGGDLDALLELLDVDAVGDFDLGGGIFRGPQHGRQVIARTTLAYLGPASGATLVSQPVNGHPGVLAFRDDELVAFMSLEARDGLIHDLHGVGDPAKLAVVGLQLALSRPR
ncbi:MAG: polymerase sigma factor SigI [Acidimicrobiales bacterium]|nr:polymerase sigma factor SigI [Acidimicrobiales bacterium]